MKIFNHIGLLTLLLVGLHLHTAAQNSTLHAANGTSLFLKSGTSFSADGLVLIPGSDYTLPGVNTLSRSAAVIQPNPNNIIQRVYQFNTTAPAFSGSIGIRFLDSELNGLSESNLVLNIFDGTAWTIYNNVTRDETNNLVIAHNLSDVTIQEITLSSVAVVPVVSLNPGSFCSADNNSYVLVATPAGGEWSGNGVVNNNDGTWSFRPSLAGQGNHELLYTLPSETGSASLHAHVAASPNKFNVTGGGVYCAGEAGLPIGLEASEPGVTYQLYLNGLPVTTLPGNGGPLNFGSRITVGTYTITGSRSGCASTMEGAAVVSVSEAATAVATANGPTTFCPSGSVMLSANVGSSYLWSNGSTARTIIVSEGGTYSVSVTNMAGCTASSNSIVVTVTDNEAPRITSCPASSFVRSSGDCNYAVRAGEFDVAATDNCNPALQYMYTLSGATQTKAPVTATSLDGVAFAQGLTTITWTIRDASGNTTSCSFAVEVKDQTPPQVPVLQDLMGSCLVQASTPVTMDNCAGPVAGTTTDPLTYNQQGTYTINWKFDDGNGNVILVPQTVVVKDVTAPVPKQNSLPDFTGECSAFVNLVPQALDNCAGTVIGKTTDPLHYNTQGTHVITWTFDDGNGNTSSQTQNVVIKDVTPPLLSGAAPQNRTVECHLVPAPANLRASDNCDASPVVTVQEQSTKGTDPNQLEFYNYTITRTWTATDAAGNQAVIATQQIKVQDKMQPGGGYSMPRPVGVTPGLCGAHVKIFKPTPQDNCSPVTITNSFNGTDDASGFYPTGSTVVTWTITDVSGNVWTFSHEVIVIDNIPPVVTGPADVSATTDAGSCTASGVNLGMPVAYDDCGIKQIINNAPQVFPIGTTQVLWYIESNSGASTFVTQNVTITDNEKPLVTPPANIAVSSDAGSCNKSGVLMGVATATDNCSITSITHDAPVVFPVGTTVVTWTATDASGNTATATQMVVVTDDEKPVVSCPAVLPSYCFNNGGYSIPKLTATDNCGISSIGYTITGTTNRSGTGTDAGTSFNPGTSVITWTVTDLSGNQSTCQATVVVIDPIVLNIPDAKALQAGVAPNTVYIGYSPAGSLTLTANVSGGAGAYSYKWNTGATTPSITVSPFDPTTYTVTVTDEKGCSKTFSKLVNVVDVRCGNNLDKVLVCHVPEGNPSNVHNLCLSVSAVATHLAEGDYLGVCGGQITQPVITDVKTLVEFSIAAMPNPSASYFTLNLSSTSDLPIKLRVTDLYGRVLETRDNITPGSTIELGSRYKAGAYFVEVIQGLEWRHVKLIKTGN